MVVGFFVSLMAGLLNLRPCRSILCFFWVFLMIMPSVLSIEAPHFLRMIGAIPPIIILVADGLTRVWGARRAKGRLEFTDRPHLAL